MRTINRRHLIILNVLLVVTALLVNVRSERSAASPGKKPLQQVFSGFGAWHSVAEFPMDAKVVEALNLDDFLFQAYRCDRGDRGDVGLYVGYYRSAMKVGAAHDPLVCFQGQGWKIDQRSSGRYTLARHPDMTISYSSMVAERQGGRQVIVYWFQANAKATANTHSQKIAMVLDKISGRNEDNAFVRLSAPVGAETAEAARRRIFEFVEDFYPHFLRYVAQG